MVDIEELVETFRKKITLASEADKYRKEVVDPLVYVIFSEKFIAVFQRLADSVNVNFDTNVLNCKMEGKNSFVIEGRFHRIIFQKGRVEIIGELVNANIIPLCIWKGVTKHLGPISFVTCPDSERVEWDLPTGNVEEYAGYLFKKLADDEDFYM